MKLALPLVLLALLVAGCGSSGGCKTQGTELVIRAVPQRGQQLTPSGMHLAQQIIGSRVQTLGVVSPRVTLRGSDEIVVQYAGRNAKPDVARMVADTGQLQIFDFEKDLAPPTVQNGNPTPYPTLYSLLWTVRAEAATGTPEAYYLFGFKQHAKEQYPVLQGPDPTRKTLLARYRGTQPRGTTILAVPAGRDVVSGPQATAATRPVGRSPDGRHWYLFRIDPSSPDGPPELSSNDVKESAIEVGNDVNTGQPQVQFGFTRRGAKEFQAITKAEYDRGRLVAGLHGSAGRLNPQYAQHNAIVLDNRLWATPYIDYTDSILSLGIAGGSAVIDNMGSLQAAKNLALVLKTGALPYLFKQVSLGPVCLR